MLVPGNHDARNVGYVRFEDTFGPRDSRHRMRARRLDVAIVAVDSSKPDLDEGEIGREHYGWIRRASPGAADLRVFVCHHHLVAIPGTGRERNQVLDAGDVLALLRDCRDDIVLSGHRHVPYVWPVAGMLLVHSGTVSTRDARLPEPAYNLVRVDDEQIEVELRVPGGERHSLGGYPRNWPEALTARDADPFTRFSRAAAPDRLEDAVFSVEGAIETERLVLRPFRESDVDDVHAIRSRPDVMRYLYGEVRSRQEVEEIVAERVTLTTLREDDDALVLAAERQEDGRVIGELTLWLRSAEHRQGEIGFVFHPDVQGRGYAREAATALLHAGVRAPGPAPGVRSHGRSQRGLRGTDAPSRHAPGGAPAAERDLQGRVGRRARLRRARGRMATC